MRRPRALYISGSIGLGHVSKDLAIARELRGARPDIEILWLAGHPASEVLRYAGENVVPESERWVGASEIAERCIRNGQLNLVRYVYRSLPSWVLNARLFSGVVQSYHVDIAIGNEAYEVDIRITWVLPEGTMVNILFPSTLTVRPFTNSSALQFPPNSSLKKSSVMVQEESLFPLFLAQFLFFA